MEPAAIITCVECGGDAHLLSAPPPDVGFEEGDTVAYRCEDCGERFDVVISGADDDSEVADRYGT